MQQSSTNALPSGIVLKSKKGEYQIEEVLGSGSFGITYKAKTSITVANVNHTIYYAIKEFYMQDICSREADGSVSVNAAQKSLYDSQRQAFQKEAQMLNRMPAHEGIVKVNETFDANNTSYYVMEYLDESLAAYIKKQPSGHLTETAALELFAKLADAVAALHKSRRLHLDIKPENIMLKDMAPCLIDFGQSRAFDDKGRLINESETACTDGYAPEEQYKGITTFAPSADIYAMGATLFFMLTGEKPVAANQMSEAYIQEKMQGASDNIRNVLVRCLAPSALSRYQTVAEVIFGLNLTISSDADDNRTTLIGMTPTGGSSSAGSSEGSGGMKKIAIAVAAVVVIAAVVFGVMQFAGGSDDKAEAAVAQTETPATAAETPAQDAAEAKTPAAPAATTDAADAAKHDGAKAANDKNADAAAPAKTVPSAGSNDTPAPSKQELDYASWTGKIKNGKPEGNGTMRFTKSHTIPGTSITAKKGDVLSATFHNGKLVNGELNGNFIEMED